MTDVRPSRRIVFQGLSALGVAAMLAGCGGEDEPGPDTGAEPSPSESPADTPTSDSPSPSETTSEPAARALAATAEVPVEGGLILTDERIVITQPARGEFEAFSAVCKHQGQTVGTVADNTITCNFHGSQYDATTGDVTNGPATTGLDRIAIRVQGGQILRA